MLIKALDFTPGLSTRESIGNLSWNQRDRFPIPLRLCPVRIMSPPDHREASLRQREWLSTAISHPRSFQEHLMKLSTVKTLTRASLLAVSLQAIAVVSASPSFAASALASLDPDHDGTVDLAEAKAAATRCLRQAREGQRRHARPQRAERSDFSQGLGGRRPGQRQDGQQGRVPCLRGGPLQDAPIRTTMGRSTRRSWRARPATRCFAC